ncbi:hypothetical protein GCM10018777_11090 [Streptomyces albogriseolus]|nr:hypothetical protein GCM10018777_11090 [Streptomyces viridodiastaticus]
MRRCLAVSGRAKPFTELERALVNSGQGGVRPVCLNAQYGRCGHGIGDQVRDAGPRAGVRQQAAECGHFEW